MLCRLSENISAIKIHNNNIPKTNKEIEESIDSIKNSCGELNNRINKFEKDSYDCRNGFLIRKKKVDSLKLSLRSSTIEIKNNFALDNETTSDLFDSVSATGKALNIGIQKFQIRDVYRLSSKPGKNRSIIAELSSVPLKMEMLNSVRIYSKNGTATEKLTTEMIGLKCKSAPIYIYEYLPGAMGKLFYLARGFSKILEHFVGS